MTPSRSLAAAGAALVLGALSAQPAAATVALTVAGDLQQTAVSVIGHRAPVESRATNAWAVEATDLIARAGATAADPAHGRVATRARAHADWESPDKGAFVVDDHGWTVDAQNVSGLTARIDTGADGVADWTYTFVATDDGTFNLDFDLLGTGNTFGLGGWDLFFGFAGEPLQLTHLNSALTPGVHATGGFSQALVGGFGYRVALKNHEALSLDGDLPFSRQVQGDESGRFNWEITSAVRDAVPEPAAWTLMITGFGLAGATLRRRTRLAAA